MTLVTVGYKEAKMYRHCFCVQLGEDEIASFEVFVEIKDGTAGTRGGVGG